MVMPKTMDGLVNGHGGAPTQEPLLYAFLERQMAQLKVGMS